MLFSKYPIGRGSFSAFLLEGKIRCLQPHLFTFHPLVSMTARTIAIESTLPSFECEYDCWPFGTGQVSHAGVPSFAALDKFHDGDGALPPLGKKKDVLTKIPKQIMEGP